MHVYAYIYIYAHMCVYRSVYIYIIYMHVRVMIGGNQCLVCTSSPSTTLLYFWCLSMHGNVL